VVPQEPDEVVPPPFPPLEDAVELPPLAPPLAAPPEPPLLPPLPPLEAAVELPPLPAPPEPPLPPLPPLLNVLSLRQPVDANPNAVRAATPNTIALFMVFPSVGCEVALLMSVSVSIAD
jgi:hypothetical protein